MAEEMFIPGEFMTSNECRKNSPLNFTIQIDAITGEQIAQGINEEMARILKPAKPVVCILVPIEDYQALIDRVGELEQMIAEMGK